MTIWDLLSDILSVVAMVVGVGWFIYSLDNFIDEE